MLQPRRRVCTITRLRIARNPQNEHFAAIGSTTTSGMHCRPWQSSMSRATHASSTLPRARNSILRNLGSACMNYDSVPRVCTVPPRKPWKYVDALHACDESRADARQVWRKAAW